MLGADRSWNRRRATPGYTVTSLRRAQKRSAWSRLPASAATIDIVRIAVDPARFARVRQPAEIPKRGLVYNLRPDPEGGLVEKIRTAVRPLNIELDFVGRHLGLDVDNPEAVLPDYDIVFASGRSALEALACGCAVVVLDETGCGEMVSAANVDDLRRDNFAVPPGAPASADHIRKQAERYSLLSWEALTESSRSVADYTRYLAHIEEIYSKAIALHALSRRDYPAENRAAAEYLFKLAPVLLDVDQRQRNGAEVTTTQAAMWLELSARIAALQREFDRSGLF
jgi:hypothetical protein